MAAHRHGSGPLTPPGGARLDWRDLPGWRNDDLGGAWRSLCAFATAPHPLRPARDPIPALSTLLRDAAALGPACASDECRRFIEERCVPLRLTGTDAFYTGYYEPVLEASRERTAEFTAPILARPPDLVTLAADDPRPGWAADLSALRRDTAGGFHPYPDRAAIEAAVEDGAFESVVWLRDRIECFMVQVQGSARLQLRDGSRLRLTYAGRNGLPYTSIGRLLVDTGAIDAAEMSLDRLKGWVRDNGQEPGQPGHNLLMRNRSFIFFEARPDDAPEIGPIGGAGLPLVPLRSIAVDRARWCYGLPFWVDVALAEASETFRRLCVAADTGSAIVGESRVDLFIGSGDAAGQRAGSIRHRGALTVLWPKEAL